MNLIEHWLRARKVMYLNIVPYVKLTTLVYITMIENRCTLSVEVAHLRNKVQLFWEGNKNVRNLPHGFDVKLTKLSN